MQKIGIIELELLVIGISKLDTELSLILSPSFSKEESNPKEKKEYTGK